MDKVNERRMDEVNDVEQPDIKCGNFMRSYAFAADTLNSR